MYFSVSDKASKINLKRIEYVESVRDTKCSSQTGQHVNLRCTTGGEVQGRRGRGGQWAGEGQVIRSGRL